MINNTNGICVTIMINDDDDFVDDVLNADDDDDNEDGDQDDVDGDGNVNVHDDDACHNTSGYCRN